jgi:hypothetical protein
VTYASGAPPKREPRFLLICFQLLMTVDDC